MSRRGIARNPVRGFTLVELVVTMSLSAIVVAFTAMFITAPVNAYRDQTRRAEMVDAADAVLRLMGRDIHAALPNSVRVADNGNFHALELLESVDAARYRDSGASTTPNQELDFAAPDAAFATLGELETPTDLGSSQYYLSIYNVGVPGADAYALTNVITPPGTSIGITNPGTGESQVTLAPAFRFAYGSPGHRVFLVRGPVTYLCDTSSGNITRYARYPITAMQRDNAAAFAAAGITGAVVASSVSSCEFDYSPGTSARAGLVTLAVSLSRTGPSSTQPETVRLLHQVHVENVP
jgi:MSHA biogenesis protein MshO